jgi:hypothetical protein
MMKDLAPFFAGTHNGAIADLDRSIKNLELEIVKRCLNIRR